ncbi:MAG: HAD family hydrolase [Arenicellales bacterium WSBS_2016_MAG_OTU3]
MRHLNRVWHRLRPWPDSVAGLTHLKKKFVIGTCSNGNVALIVNMAKHSGLPWDMVLGAEVTSYYKPMPQSYLESARLLGLRLIKFVWCRHNDDLTAAAANGLKTAFVARPTEHGPNQNKDLQADGEYDFVANDFIDLATQAL